MSRNRKNQERGFTMIEVAIAVFLSGIILAFATPKISNAMREYRLNIAIRQISDTLQRAKMQAVADNKRATLRVDTANSRLGIVVYDNLGNEVRTDYTSLPQGITFTMPQNVTAPETNAPTAGAVSFPAQGSSTTVFQQDFNSRGLPVVAAGAINAIYLSNGINYRAITLNCVGSTRTWRWRNTQWADANN